MGDEMPYIVLEVINDGLVEIELLDNGIEFTVSGS